MTRTESKTMKHQPPPLLSQEIGEILMLMTRDFQRRLDDDLRQRGIRGVGPRHRSVFLHLGHHGPSRAVDLAAAAGIRPQSMMKAVHELEEMGLVTREPDPQDFRAKLIRFTPTGERLIDELTVSTQTVWQQYAELVSEVALKRTFNGLKSLMQKSKTTCQGQPAQEEEA